MSKFAPFIPNTWFKLIIIHHLCVIINIDHIDRAVSVTDEEGGVIIWLQHLEKVNICSTIDENKEPELQHTYTKIITLLHSLIIYNSHLIMWHQVWFDHTCSLCSRKAVPRSCQPVTGTSVYWTWSQWNSAWWGDKKDSEILIESLSDHKVKIFLLVFHSSSWKIILNQQRACTRYTFCCFNTLSKSGNHILKSIL